MGKPPRGVGNRDAFHRMNFLHQAARLLVTASPAMARHLSWQAGAVARKCVLRVEPRVKRAACKRCATPLEPGVRSSVRMRNKRLLVRCLVCGWLRRYGLDKVPWPERPEALIATAVFDGRNAETGAGQAETVTDTRTKEERRRDRVEKKQKEGTVGESARQDKNGEAKQVKEVEPEIEKMKVLQVTDAKIRSEAMDL